MKFIITFCLSILMIPSLSIANATQTSDKIIVTLPPLSGIIMMLLPEVQTQCLLSAGADPHHFQPSPKQVDLLNQHHLLIRASYDDQGWPIHVQNSQVIDVWPNKNHAWLQFEQVRSVLPVLAKALSSKFPQYRKDIEVRLIHAIETTHVLEKEWDMQLEQLKSKGVFVQHPAWHDLLESKQVPIWAVLESHQHGHEHGPRHLEKALSTLKQHPDAALLGSKRHSNRSLEWLNNHQGNSKHIITLDALGNCNQPWDKLMRHNLEVLSKNL